MELISYSNFRKNLAEMMDKVNDDCNPIIITRQKGEAAVLISLKDFNAYQETNYLLSSPKNAERLRESIAETKKGNVFTHDLLED